MEKEHVRAGIGNCKNVVSGQGLPMAPLQGTESAGTPVAFSLSASA